MASGPHLERRGAVYYWRRRLPPVFARIVSRTHFRMNLGTKEPALARRLAARLEATASELFAETGGGGMMEITGEQLEALFVDVLKAHKTKLAKLADLNRRDGTLGDPLEEMRQERAMGWAYRILARNGVAARIYDHDRETMRQAGLDETAIARVAATLDWMHASDMA